MKNAGDRHFEFSRSFADCYFSRAHDA